MYYSDRQSWNLRDSHMFDTLVRILKHRGKNSKAIVWAHNSHIGDARATSMGWERREHNVGQLAKEIYGSEVIALGCGTYTGTVAAADDWGGKMQVMKVNPGRENSYEALMHNVGIPCFYIDIRKGKCEHELREKLIKARL